MGGDAFVDGDWGDFCRLGLVKVVGRLLNKKDKEKYLIKLYYGLLDENILELTRSDCLKIELLKEGA